MSGEPYRTPDQIDALIEERDAAIRQRDEAIGTNRIMAAKMESMRKDASKDSRIFTNVVTYITALAILIVSVVKFISVIYYGDHAESSLAWLGAAFVTLAALRMLVTKAWL